MTVFTVAPEEIEITINNDALSTYQFATRVAKHHFCRFCGIYTFHETLRKPGHFRLNIGCIEGIKSLELPADVFNGAEI